VTYAAGFDRVVGDGPRLSFVADVDACGWFTGNGATPTRAGSTPNSSTWGS
jgi:hypothetical protein